jgi:hypothetical protein
MIMDGSDDIHVVKQSCGTCYDSKSKDQFVTLSCSHSACRECLQRQIDIGLKDQSTKNLRCFTCWTHHFTQEEIEKIVTPEQREKLGTIQLKEWLEKQSLVKHCPTPDCNYAFINESKCQSTIDCPQCKKEYCSQCLIKHPEYLSCQAAQERYASVEDKATQSWKNTHSKPCPQCKASIEKNYGCDHMTCSKCRYEFCWKCLGKYPCPRGYLCNGQIERNQQTIRGQNMPTQIEVRADMPRDFQGFANMLQNEGIRVLVNQNGTLQLTTHMMHWNNFNRILEHANALYR